MVSSPITSWQIDGETIKTVTEYFLGFQSHCIGDCSHEIKRHLPLERKAMTNLDSVLKSRDITLPTKVHLVNAMAYLVVMYRCECWTEKESWVLRIWHFWTVVLEKTLESPLDCREIKPVNPKGNQSWIFIGRTDAIAEIPIFGHLMGRSTYWKRPTCWEWLKAGGEGDDRGWHGWMASPTQWTWVWASSKRWWWTGKTGVMQSTGLQRVGHDWATELNWTEQY